MNESTIAMPCDYMGYVSDMPGWKETTSKFAVVDIDCKISLRDDAFSGHSTDDVMAAVLTELRGDRDQKSIAAIVRSSTPRRVEQQG